jgi:hypothetical protein
MKIQKKENGLVADTMSQIDGWTGVVSTYGVFFFNL